MSAPNPFQLKASVRCSAIRCGMLDPHRGKKKKSTHQIACPPSRKPAGSDHRWRGEILGAKAQPDRGLVPHLGPPTDAAARRWRRPERSPSMRTTLATTDFRRAARSPCGGGPGSRFSTPKKKTGPHHDIALRKWSYYGTMARRNAQSRVEYGCTGRPNRIGDTGRGAHVLETLMPYEVEAEPRGGRGILPRADGSSITPAQSIGAVRDQ